MDENLIKKKFERKKKMHLNKNPSKIIWELAHNLKKDDFTKQMKREVIINIFKQSFDVKRLKGGKN